MVDPAQYGTVELVLSGSSGTLVSDPEVLDDLGYDPDAVVTIKEALDADYDFGPPPDDVVYEVAELLGIEIVLREDGEWEIQ